MKSSKVIADPIYGIIDIRPVLAMVDTPEFQALGDKRQLGMSYLIFPSATHTRKAHSLGAYHATQNLARRWIELGIITRREADALAGYALYHDIGHPAFSHVTEPLCPMPAGIRGMSVNSALSLGIIRRRKKEIEACGIDFKLLESFAAHRNPLHLAVSDKNLGMEKLDYLERDGLCTILSRPAGVEYLRNHIYFANNELVIDEKAIDTALETQNFYLKMYKNVYLRKTSAIAQRMFQKMTHGLILAGELAAADLPYLTDSELFGMMRLSKSAAVQEMYELFKLRQLYREAIVLRPRSSFIEHDLSEKAIANFGVDARDIAKLIAAPQLQIANQAGLAALEEDIAMLAGLPERSVLVVPIMDPGRFEAKDILVSRGFPRNTAEAASTARGARISRTARGGRPTSLKARYPAHFKNMEEVAKTYVAFRICTTEPYRRTLSAPKIVRKIAARILGK
jgi:HD superfamily phosphohydrolase